MAFMDCLKNKFNCISVLKSRKDAVTALKDEIELIEKESDQLKKDVITWKNKIASKEKQIVGYSNYATLWNDMPPIEEVGKPTTEKEIRQIFEESWDCKLVDGGHPNKASMGSHWNNPDRNVEAHFTTGNFSYRIPMNIMKMICQGSMVSEWTHAYTADHPSGIYACNDFAASFWSEFKAAPLGYFNTMIGVLGVKGHRINCFIPDDEDKVYYIEPQSDRIWFPDLSEGTKERTPFQVIL